MRRRRIRWLTKDLAARSRLDEAALVAVLSRALTRSFDDYSGDEPRLRAIAGVMLARGWYRSAEALASVLRTRKDGL